MTTEETNCLGKLHDMRWDALRIIACFFVIVNHTNSEIFLNKSFSISWVISNFLFNMCRMNVVIFIIISGALLLDKEESLLDWFQKRVLRIVMVIIIFSLLYYPLENFSIIAYFKTIFSTHITNAFWYLYMYLGLMISLPILRPLARNLENKGYYILFFYYIFKQGISPLLIHYFGFPLVSPWFKVSLMETYSWFPLFLFGYFLKHRIAAKIFTQKGMYISIILYFVCVMLPTIITGYEFFALNDKSLTMDNPFLPWAMLATLCIVYIVSFVCKQSTDLKPNKSKWISKMSATTFGIYLISDFLIKYTHNIYIYMADIIKLPDVIAMLVWIFLIFFGAMLISTMLRKIPLLNKIL